MARRRVPRDHGSTRTALLPEIVNEEACAAALEASTDPADLIFVRLVEGHAAEAAELLAEARYKNPGSLRLRIFEADVLRVSNRYDRAVELFRQLLAETQGTPDEASSASTWAGATSPAATSPPPSNPSPRRWISGWPRSADAALIYASTVALQRARDVLDWPPERQPGLRDAAVQPGTPARRRTGRIVLGFLINTRWRAAWHACLA